MCKPKWEQCDEYEVKDNIIFITARVYSKDKVKIIGSFNKVYEVPVFDFKIENSKTEYEEEVMNFEKVFGSEHSENENFEVLMTEFAWIPILEKKLKEIGYIWSMNSLDLMEEVITKLAKYDKPIPSTILREFGYFLNHDNQIKYEEKNLEDKKIGIIVDYLIIPENMNEPYKFDILVKFDDKTMTWQEYRGIEPLVGDKVEFDSYGEYWVLRK